MCAVAWAEQGWGSLHAIIRAAGSQSGPFGNECALVVTSQLGLQTENAAGPLRASRVDMGFSR